MVIEKSRKLRAFFTVLVLLASAPAFSMSTFAQPDSRTFPETGKTVSGKFLSYWNEHGGLAQQGLPISAELQEKSDTDGKTYTVQYFERAVFESHPENQPPNDVLLSLLGALAYKQLYPGQTGAPGQVPNPGADSRLFPETGKHIGGIFLAYWQQHGALAQQGYPVSEEFTEVSAQDHKPYKVQYFQRAVFEYHPENQAPNDVLLSLLGAFRYKQKYQTPHPAATAVKPTPGANPAATATSEAPSDQPDCSGIPPNQNVTFINPPNYDPRVHYKADCAPDGSNFEYIATGFQIGEDLGVYTTSPSGEVDPIDVGYASADGKGEYGGYAYGGYEKGIWTLTVEGVTSHRKAIGHFKVVRYIKPEECSNIPQNVNMTITPNCGPQGTYFMMDASGFLPGEQVAMDFGAGPAQPRGGADVAGPDGKFPTYVYHSGEDDALGLHEAIFTGVRSGRQAIGWFEVTYNYDNPPPP